MERELNLVGLGWTSSLKRVYDNDQPAVGGAEKSTLGYLWPTSFSEPHINPKDCHLASRSGSCRLAFSVIWACGNLCFQRVATRDPKTPGPMIKMSLLHISTLVLQLQSLQITCGLHNWSTNIKGLFSTLPSDNLLKTQRKFRQKGVIKCKPTNNMQIL